MQQIKELQPHKKQKGFALLITLIVVTALISIGLSVLDLSVRQVRLASISSDSEIAFHAANAGLECGSYLRREAVFAADEEAGNDISPECFEVSSSPSTVSSTNVPLTGGSEGEAYLYEFDFTWGSPLRCSQIVMMVITADVGGAGATTNNPVRNYIPGFPTNDPKTCSPGGRCAVIASRGFNKECADINTYGTVQREVLLQL